MREGSVVQAAGVCNDRFGLEKANVPLLIF